MDWRIVLCLIGFVIGYWLYNKYQYRAGGVIVVPLVAIYTLSYPMMFFVLVGITAITFILMEYIFHKKFIYGRNMMYLGYLISLLLGILLMISTNVNKIELEWFPLLLCGMVAYNFHREKNSKVETRFSGVVTLCYLALMVFIGFILMVVM